MTSSPTASIELPGGPSAGGALATARSARGLRRPGDRRLGWPLGLLAWALAAAGSWVPVFWGDEAASIQSAQRPLPSLFRMLGHLDAVHGTYYVFLHFWIEVFGTSAFAVRTPSAIATGLAAVGLYFLVRELRSRRLAVVAVVVFAVLPRTFAFGDETRSYAFTAAFAAWALYLLVRLVGRGETSRRAWLGYAVLMGAGVYVFLYFGLFVIVHGLVLLQARAPREVVRRWAVATAGVVVAASPVIVFGVAQRGQVAFLAGQGNMNPQAVLKTTWFGNWWIAGVAWAFIAIAVAFLVADAVRDRRVRTDAVERPRPISLGWLALAWLLAPLGALMVGSAAVANFTPRYLSYSTPAAAILVAAGIVRLAGLLARGRARRAPVATAVGTALIVGMAVPEFLDARSATAKNNTDWRAISQTLGANAAAGDAVVFDESTQPWRLVRSAKYLYPAGFAGLRDVTLETPYADTVSWHDEVYPVEKALSLGRFHGVSTVWLVEYARDRYGVKALEEAGFEVERTLTVKHAVILKLVR